MSNGETTIQSRLETARAEFIFSGYQLYAERKGRVLDLHGGVTSYWDGGVSVEAFTFFDIGSVTKAVVTTTLLALAVEEKKLSIDDPVQHWVDSLRGVPLGGIPVKALLSHSSGIKWWHPLYSDPDSKSLADWFRDHASDIAENPPGKKAVYSDLGFLVLGLVIEKLFGKIETAFAEKITKPLGMTETVYGPVDPAKCAATEVSAARGRLLHGEVFDENCSFLGGRCSHAGLFSTARGLAPWAREWVHAYRGESKWISEKTAKLFASVSNLAPASHWALGWDTKSPKGSSAGEKFSSKSFGHLGYPGCSVWCDPEAGGFAIFHTNRVHPSRLDERIKKLRPQVHDLIADWWA